MDRRVYEVRGRDRARLEHALTDDVVSRTSIELRDAQHFGWDRDTVFVVLEGTEDSMRRADELLLRFGRVPANADAVHRRVQWEAEASARGLGTVFAQLPEPEFKTTVVERQLRFFETAWREARDAWRRFRRGVNDRRERGRRSASAPPPQEDPRR